MRISCGKHQVDSISPDMLLLCALKVAQSLICFHIQVGDAVPARVHTAHCGFRFQREYAIATENSAEKGYDPAIVSEPDPVDVLAVAKLPGFEIDLFER